jgi:glycosyltransferase involved in cell wall biosynthesis
MKGGAEKVLRVFAEMFPDAPIYTFLYDEQKLGDWFPKERVRTSRLQKTANRLSLIAPRSLSFNHHLYLPFFPRAAEAFDFSEFDLVLSSSSAFAHGIITNGNPLHLSYVHSPARYLWDRTHDVMARSAIPLSYLFHRLRIWDSEAADRPDMLLAASHEVQRRIELYWRRESAVLYPPIDDEWLEQRDAPTGAMERPDYFLIVSTLARYKRIDLAINACNLAGVHLKIVGEGPDARRLKRMAGTDIEFYGWRSGDELKDLYTRAKATIIPGEEDFGLVALESLACGTPVIAYKKGGATETVTEGKTGTFFAEPSAKSLRDTLVSFDRRQFQESALQRSAAAFAKKHFIAEMHKHVAVLLASRTIAQ